MAVQYGNRQTMCDILIPAYNNKEDMVSTFANFTNTFWGNDFGSGCFYDTQCLQGNGDGTMARSWRWQKCLQMAYLQVAPPKGSIRSTTLTLNVLLEQCKDIFGEKMLPSTDVVNEKYGGDEPKGDHIVFADAQQDPWTQA